MNARRTISSRHIYALLAIAGIFCISFAQYYYIRIFERDGSAWFFDWMRTQYSLSYFDQGLQRRALVGTLRDLLGKPDIVLSMYAVTLSSLMVLAWQAAKFLRALSSSREPELPLTLTAVLILSPFTLSQIAFDVGRFDALNLVLLLCALGLLNRGMPVPATGLCLVAILIHEAFIVWGVPLLVVAASRPSSLFGVSSHRTPERAATLGIGISAFALLLILLALGRTATVLQDSEGTGQAAWNRGFLEPSIGATPAGTVLLLTLLVLMYTWLTLFYRANRGTFDLPCVAAILPTGLFLLGTDSARWLGLIFWVILIVTCCKVSYCKWHLPLGIGRVILTALCLPLGAAGVGQLFPLLRSLPSMPP